jgi:transketolase
MRKDFAKWLLSQLRDNEEDGGSDIYLLTADMGYGLWDDVRKEFPDKFVNCGSSEQLMIGMAAGLAMEGKIPVCYSITPFLLYRPFEFIRNYMDREKLPIKLVGGGRDFDYGYLGFTHWADDDERIMGALKNVQFFKPNKYLKEPDLNQQFTEAIHSPFPSYINLCK